MTKSQIVRLEPGSRVQWCDPSPGTNAPYGIVEFVNEQCIMIRWDDGDESFLHPDDCEWVENIE